MFLSFVLPIVVALFVQLILHSNDTERNVDVSSMTERQLIAAGEAWHLLSNARDSDQKLLEVFDFVF